jgi:hypothetical protein
MGSDPLPYTFRTHSYNAFSTFVIGDTRTVGMGGATAGLADTFLAGVNNPGGLAMTMGVGDTNITKNDIRDGDTQNFDNLISPPSSLGASLNVYPWTFSLGTVPIGWEGQSYDLPSTGAPSFAGQSAGFVVESHEFRATAARAFLNNRLGLGMSLNIGVGEEEISVPAQSLDDDRHAVAFGASWGAMYQFPNRILLGASYTLPMHYAVDTSSAPEFPGFFQSMDTPSHLELGLGWIPNRYFRADIQLSRVGETPGAALLSNDRVRVGESNTWQPKIGAAYIFMDYKNIQGTLFGGGYYETSRIELAGDRLHKTAGMELKAWIFTAGTGIDAAPAYRNSFYSIGIDLGIVLQRLNLMPTPWAPDRQGTFPNPFYSSDEGLARPLVKDWKPEGPQFDLIEVIKDFPKNVEREAKRIGNRASNP